MCSIFSEHEYIRLKANNWICVHDFIEKYFLGRVQRFRICLFDGEPFFSHLSRESAFTMNKYFFIENMIHNCKVYRRAKKLNKMLAKIFLSKIENPVFQTPILFSAILPCIAKKMKLQSITKLRNPDFIVFVNQFQNFLELNKIVEL